MVSASSILRAPSTVWILHGLGSSPKVRIVQQIGAICRDQGIPSKALRYPPQEVWRIQDWTIFLADELKKQPDQDTILVGESMGAWLSLKAALIVPEKIAGIFGLSLGINIKFKFIETMFPGVGHSEIRTRMEAGEVFTSPFPTGGATVRLDLKSTENYFENCPALFPAVDCPVHLVSSEKDPVCPSANVASFVEQMRAAGKTPQFTLVPGGAHQLNMEIPVVLSAFCKFMGERGVEVNEERAAASVAAWVEEYKKKKNK